MDIKTVTVIGAGTMGNGIAHVFARAGFRVLLRDLEQSFLDRALGNIIKSLDREIAKERLSPAERDQILARIEPAVGRAGLALSDFVVEAASEKFETKAELFRELDTLCRPDVIFASNTSSISITKLAAATRRPERVIGMH
ncbi:MAG: 3-hydroxyacyl-CoA dehydrogenase NAD-binding domain-containing protein, partial [Candidatus Korobacteraceae bacterium]